MKEIKVFINKLDKLNLNGIEKINPRTPKEFNESFKEVCLALDLKISEKEVDNVCFYQYSFS